MTKTALVSVYDKEGIVDYVRYLMDEGWTIISSGGTYDHLHDHGLKVKKVESVTQFPELLGGRVKTLHPAIHSGILARRGIQEDLNDLKKHSLFTIDMVICNLYPFEEAVKNKLEETKVLEMIDIGGPSMIRAAAKNYRDVYVLTDPLDYQNLRLLDRKKLAGKAFSLSAHYDRMIAQYFNPEIKHIELQKKTPLRYGENPHQEAVYYEEEFPSNHLKQLHGKELSYNNINDLTQALKMVHEFERPSVVAVKHANPCGIASGDTIDEAFKKAKSVDPVSIFGGIIAANKPIDFKTANEMNSLFLEVIVAPSFTKEALELLEKKKNLRLIEFSNMDELSLGKWQIKDVINGYLVQEQNSKLLNEKLKTVSKRQASKEEIDELMFAWKACKHMDSNGIVLAKNHQTLGLGHGEVRRSWSLEKAIAHSEFPVAGSVMASDGFFFEDTVEICHQNGIDVMIQPGGSIHDAKVIELADKYNMVLIFTGMRHFQH
ncbi:bifunctional phosphoribosylaminoimidazolecarboxamide formyltransferase/IMP cyclohydrolase [Erysipelothrix urinaevulpis]|uniref:bifunctional phosphoribosylaminoimidazolecarboxamide formyltransferase/IMP cyclohydrolase n=1 Tax=Erysipelothrix urinaevulpis TaxID=2683717 RepID=UPI0013593FF0|nr:bifunctional phosphoribosylaminoimidazolecarboxamide formyltransferase/IMP cyclohydrolase [Erysipelothrix urinaevulpis]